MSRREKHEALAVISINGSWLCRTFSFVRTNLVMISGGSWTTRGVNKDDGNVHREIDRCLKKVTEGVETFEDIWQKVHNATNSNQKEKYEADLKKEIKKLQRLRDQIKSWIASGEIKDKSTLLDYRKLIETQMERFKVVERETKTKAYSKEGLGAAQKLDPAQKEKDEVTNWLANSIDALNLQMDTFESEIESLQAGKKKRIDKDKQDRVDELKAKLDKHRYHIRKLETLLRMLDNMSVEVNTIKRIKDDVEYYIESSQDPDFEENEYIYDDIIGLDEVELSGVGIPSSATTDSNNSNETGGTPTSTNSCTSPIPSPSLSSTMHNHSSDSSTDNDKKTKFQPVKPTAVRPLLNTQASIPTTGSTATIKSNMLSSSTPSKTIPMTPSHSSPSSTSNHIATTNAGNFATVAASHSNSQAIHSTSNKTSSKTFRFFLTRLTIHVECSDRSICTFVAHNSENNILSSSSTSSVTSNVPQTIAQQHNNNPAPAQTTHVLHSQQSQNHNSETEMTTPIPPSSSPQSSVSSRSSPMPANSCSPAPSTANGLIPKLPDGSMSSLKSIAQQVIVRAGLEIPPSEPNRNIFDSAKTSNSSNNNATSEAHIPPLLGVAPLGPVPLQKEHQLQFQMMEAAYYHMPHPSDSERLPSSFGYCGVLPTPFYGNFILHILLYGGGTYIYFDYEKWGQRKKEGFTFEYKYLEDRDLN
ncbi:CCR4-NOT transcription complex subunit 3 [Atta colombica]|uniref:CCR4-NOT transcription complex subunit 3 n=1 Tax=Atta colombica TaxID=520822 RepID=A0A195AVW1_9HYME|nr:CCR4-NOT transcription complex subunit 3 [Atta colombica]